MVAFVAAVVVCDVFDEVHTQDGFRVQQLGEWGSWELTVHIPVVVVAVDHSHIIVVCGATTVVAVP